MTFLSTVEKNRDSYIVALGQKVKELRRERNLTQLQLAIDSGIPLSQINAIEGGRVNTTVATLRKMAITLEVDMKVLFDFEF